MRNFKCKKCKKTWAGFINIHHKQNDHERCPWCLTITMKGNNK